MTTSEKKPYHKSRHPWRDQDLRSEANKACGPRHVAVVDDSVRPKPRPCPFDVEAGVRTLLANHDGDPNRPLLSKEQNMNIAAVRVWLTKS